MNVEKEVFKPGIYDISNDRYHSSAGISRSGIMHFRKTPYHYWHKYLNPDLIKKGKSEALEFGAALHPFILEPEKFYEEYCIIPKFDKRTTAGKACHSKYMDENVGKTFLEEDDFFRILNMRNAIHSDPSARELIIGADYEQSIYWIDPETQLLCKCRPDILFPNFVVDLKTTKDAEFKSFSRDFYHYGYHLQIAMIHLGMKHALGIEMNNFIDLAIEKQAPFLFAIYPVDQDFLEYGLEEFHFHLRRMKECFDKNVWPAYPTQTIMRPSYAKFED